MKKYYVLFFLTFSVAIVQASILRVNNTPGYAAGYTSLAAAITAANAGDTIYVEPSPDSYDVSIGVIQISKKVIIVGNGYFLTTNTNLQVRNNDSAVQPVLQFKDGSQGSVVTGINIKTRIDVLTNTITIKRCAVNSIYLGANPQTGEQINTTQTTIVECFIYGSTAISATGSGNSSALIIKNNIFDYFNYPSIAFSIGDNGIFENNTVRGSIEFNNSVFNFVNNLVYTGLSNFGNVASSNNTCACATGFPTGSNNAISATWNDLFLGGSNDQYYRTNPSGLAANTGFYGANDDRGAFTDEPGRPTYRLGGIPAYPAIYKLLGGGTVNGPTIQVKVSARSNN